MTWARYDVPSTEWLLRHGSGYTELDLEWHGVIERDRDAVDEFDDSGDSERNGRSAVYGWNRKSDDHDGGLPTGNGHSGRERDDSQFAYWTNTNGLGAAPLYVTNANTVEQYNGTNVQTFNVYGTYTNSSN